MSHYFSDGQLVGWGPTVNEIDHLADLFDEVRHIGCLHGAVAPTSSLPYQTDRLTFVPIAPSGGTRLRDKVAILTRVPGYLHALLRELPAADAVHVRCPSNVGLLTILLLAVTRRPRTRWIKYAGNWDPTSRAPRSYRLQRWLLQYGIARGAVTVNGDWPGQGTHVREFHNPCLTRAEQAAAAACAQGKRLGTPVRLLFVGALNTSKGTGRALDIFARLRRMGLDATLEVVGDGPDRPAFERQAAELGIAREVSFRGWLPRLNLGSVYEHAHILLSPSGSEGWPKVLSEAMAYGVVPVAGAVSSIPKVLRATGAGIALPPDDLDAFAAAILALAIDPERWARASRAGTEAAAAFTYEAYLDAVRSLFGEMGTELRGGASGGQQGNMPARGPEALRAGSVPR
jgi:glycosyltransferase involved in cell wall biosynthesis